MSYDNWKLQTPKQFNPPEGIEFCIDCEKETSVYHSVYVETKQKGLGYVCPRCWGDNGYNETNPKVLAKLIDDCEQGKINFRYGKR